MIQRAPNWAGLRTFVEVACDGSLSGAVRRLGLVRADRRLLYRCAGSGAGIHVVDVLAARSDPDPGGAGARAACRSHGGSRRLDAASGEAAADRGAVRVTTSEIIGREVLPSTSPPFMPSILASPSSSALSNRSGIGAPRRRLAARMVRPTQSGLVARCIGVSRIELYAHRDYLARFGEPRSLADLANHCLIGFDRDNSSFRGAGDLRAALTRETFGFRCDNDLAQLAALRAGVGVGGCQENIARRTPSLSPVPPNAFHYAMEVWLVMHEDLKRRGACAFIRSPCGRTDDTQRSCVIGLPSCCPPAATAPKELLRPPRGSLCRLIPAKENKMAKVVCVLV